MLCKGYWSCLYTRFASEPKQNAKHTRKKFIRLILFLCRAYGLSNNFAQQLCPLPKHHGERAKPTEQARTHRRTATNIEQRHARRTTARGRWVCSPVSLLPRQMEQLWPLLSVAAPGADGSDYLQFTLSFFIPTWVYGWRRDGCSSAWCCLIGLLQVQVAGCGTVTGDREASARPTGSIGLSYSILGCQVTIDGRSWISLLTPWIVFFLGLVAEHWC